MNRGKNIISGKHFLQTLCKFFFSPLYYLDNTSYVSVSTSAALSSIHCTALNTAGCVENKLPRILHALIFI